MSNRHKSEEEEAMGENHHHEGNSLPKGMVATLQFPIQQPKGIAPMKNISLSLLARFYGKEEKYPNEFLFEFDILYRSYDYTTNAQKLKLFSATLKDNALHWFMSLGGRIVTNWDKMKQVFLEKYQEYCNTKDKREELIKMVQRDDEILEDLVERILYNVQRAGQTNMGLDCSK